MSRATAWSPGREHQWDFGPRSALNAEFGYEQAPDGLPSYRVRQDWPEVLRHAYLIYLAGAYYYQNTAWAGGEEATRRDILWATANRSGPGYSWRYLTWARLRHPGSYVRHEYQSKSGKMEEHKYAEGQRNR